MCTAQYFLKKYCKNETRRHCFFIKCIKYWINDVIENQWQKSTNFNPNPRTWYNLSDFALFAISRWEIAYIVDQDQNVGLNRPPTSVVLDWTRQLRLGHTK